MRATESDNLIDTVKSLSRLLRQTFGERLDASAKTFVEMFADDGVMEFPYAIPTARRIEAVKRLPLIWRQTPAKLNFSAYLMSKPIRRAIPK